MCPTLQFYQSRQKDEYDLIDGRPVSLIVVSGDRTTANLWPCTFLSLVSSFIATFYWLY